MRNQKYWKKCMALMLSASMILPSASVVMAEDMAAEFVSQETMVEESDETDAASQEMVETEQEQDVQEQPEEAFGDMDSVEEPVEAEADADAEKIAYTVNYYNADGTELLKTETKESKAQKCSFGAFSGAPAVEGKLFIGWSTQKAASAIEYNTTKGPVLTKDAPELKLYAVYVNAVQNEKVSINVHVEYIDNEIEKGYKLGDTKTVQVTCRTSGAHKEAGITHQIKYADIAAAAKDLLVVEDGYELVGMTKNAGTNQTVFGLDNTSMVSGMSQGGDFYLVAKKVYTLNYDANGENVTGMPETQTAVSSTGSAALTISSVKPQREGYTFLGWADKKDAANPNVFVGKDVTLTSAAPVKILYAVWGTSHKVIYKSYDGAEELYTDTKAGTGDCSFNAYTKAPEREGYVFIGWSKTANSEVIDYNTTKGPVLGKDVTELTLYAVYAKTVQSEEVKINVHVEYFDDGLENGFEIGDTKEVTVICQTSGAHKEAGITHQIKYADLANAAKDLVDVKDGYELVGMTKNAGTNQTIFGLDNTFMVSGMSQGGDFYLVAKRAYSLSFDGNGEDAAGVPKSQKEISTTGSVTFTIPAAPARPEYEFLGWAEKADAQTATYKAGDTVTLTRDAQNKTLYAIWKKIKRNSSITAAASVSKTYGDGAFALNVKKTGNGTLVYTVDNSDVVSVDANGTVTIKKAGTAVITVSVAETEDYLAAQSQKITVTAVKAQGKGEVSMEGWTEGQTASAPVAKSQTNGNQKVTYLYKVSGAADSTYKAAVPTAAGKYTVKATFAENENYKAVVATAEFTISAAPKDNTVSRLSATAAKTSIKLKWTRIPSAAGYEIYGRKCDKGAYKLLKTVTKNTTTSWSNTKLKKATGYSYYVKAYTVKNGVKTYIKTSNTIHVTTAGGTSTNVKAVKVSKKTISLKKGKSTKLKVTQTLASKKLSVMKHAAKLTYSTTNKKVATVSKTGVVKAKGKGSCYIYVRAASGAYAKVKIKVK